MNGNYLLAVSIAMLTLVMFVGALPKVPIYPVLVIIGVILSNFAVVIAVIELNSEGMYWGYVVAGANSFLLGPYLGLIFSIILGVAILVIESYRVGYFELISFGASFSLLIYFIYIFSLSVRQKQDKLKHLTMTALTDLGNRRAMDIALQDEIARAQRLGVPSSLIAIDLDHFKKINDTDGHDMGDRFLVDFTNVLHRRARRTDKIFRTGGDEFLIIAPATTADHALELAEDLRLETLAIELSGTTGCSMSAGISELQPNQTAESWLKQADSTLYKAKVNGRNRVLVANTSEN
jgi:diguanylate cyclase (GGDEF)-like protein